jgi:hypothetical protein
MIASTPTVSVKALLSSFAYFCHVGIPRLPRVVDALSTIMWPSMQPHDRSTSKQAQVPDVKVRELLDWAQDITLVHDSTAKKTPETDDLERWLLSDSVLHGDPWGDAAGTITMSPIAMKDTGTLQGPTTCPSGFDDDFTVFVSAPSAEGLTSVGGRGFGRTVEVENLSLESDLWDEDENRLSAGIGAYASLGSASDFGSEDGPHSEYQAMKDSEDNGLPTEEEIRATSGRIFGVPPVPSKIETADALAVDVHTPTTGKASFDDIPSSNDVPEEEHDAAPFDLSRVLSTLEEMKAEIAGIDDEAERRKAAARVALGLVYGLEGKH